ncbi:MAG TPA: hypothetical protein VM841_08075 [Actinomycetota bacterium]|nr:hypothetical protein [Actinomycetota bacterium]
MLKRLFVSAVAVAMLVPFGGAQAAPIDTWPVTHGIDCLNDPFNPTRSDGTKDPAGDPLPGTAAWIERDRQRLECDNQRDHDRRYHPHNSLNSGRYGEDWYRNPHRFDGRRWRYDYIAADAQGLYGIPGVPAAEIFRPCKPLTCLNKPAELERFAPPYPVVVIHHGFIAQMTHHRFNAQVYAEAGYMAIVVNGIHPVTGVPNVQDSANGAQVLDWLASPASGEIGRQADLSRVAMVGHSQGAAAALSNQGDPRVDAIVAWDGGDSISDLNCKDGNPCAPVMYQRTDGAFSAPQATARAGYPATRERGVPTYLEHKARDMNVYHITMRASNHIDWNGNGVGSLAGSRLAEPWINYYTLAWLDLHLRGQLVRDGNGNIVTQHGRSAWDERWFRQGIVNRAFNMLTSKRFLGGTIDKHNISQGFYDPVQMATSGDPLFGGNVPYQIEDLWVVDRLSPEFRNLCSLTVPNYVTGGTLATADTGVAGDIRLTGCPVL